MATVVILHYNRGARSYDNQLFDSATMSGAARKANGYLRSTFHVVTEKRRFDNYDYWYCEDIADLPRAVHNRMLASEKQEVDARPFFRDGEKSARMKL